MMHNQSKMIRFAQTVLLAAACSSVGAQETTELPQGDNEPQIQFGGDLYVEAQQVFNANRTPVDDDQVEELQTRYGANLRGSIDREIVSLLADYDFYQNDYSEDTQEDRFIRTGRSSLIVGTEQTFYQLDVTHSTQRFLRDPEGPAILANTDQRDVTSATPLLRLRRGTVGSVAVVGHFADVRYKSSDLNNSERYGFGLQALRDTSPVHTLGLTFLQNEIDYKYGEAGDYTYRRAAVTFGAELRELNYSIELGANEADPMLGEGGDGLFFDLGVTHTTYDSRWTFTAHQSITDTSLGNANDPFFSEGFTSDVSPLVQDQLERRSLGASVQSAMLCRRCEVSLRIGYEDESYFNVVTEDNEESFVATALGYQLRPSVALQLSLDHRIREFQNSATVNDYAESSVALAVDVDPFYRYLRLRFWLEHDYRHADTAGQSYGVSYIGTGLSYRF